jgi:hypothetical protein
MKRCKKNEVIALTLVFWSEYRGMTHRALQSSLVEHMESKNEGAEQVIEMASCELEIAEITEGALARQTDVAQVGVMLGGDKAVTREQRRSRRKREVRARTISVKRMTKRELELGRVLYPDVDNINKPRERAHCASGERPCPFVSCKHHLFLDVSARTGAIKLNFPDLEVWEMNETCALDVADRGGTTLEEVGAIMNLTRERIRQVEVKGLAKLQALGDMSALRDYVEEGPVGKRRLPVLTKNDDEEDSDESEDSDDDESCNASECVSDAV